MSETSNLIPMTDVSLFNERIMLVGGMGFIGHHLAMSLKNAGAEVLVIDSLQVNNIIKILSDPELDETRRSLYLNFIVERSELLRLNGIRIKSADARNLNELSHIFDKFKSHEGGGSVLQDKKISK